MAKLMESKKSKLAKEIRVFETNDIVDRLGYLKADQIEVKNYPLKPYKIFNATFGLTEDTITIFTRGVFDYYKYVSAIIKFEIELNQVLSGNLEDLKFAGKAVIIPSEEEDFWGAEDPRYIVFGEKKIVAYTGRTKWYYQHSNENNYKTVTMLAVELREDEWKKIGYLVPPNDLLKESKSIKNCLILKGENRNYVACRIHTWKDEFLTIIGKLDGSLESSNYTQIKIKKPQIVLNPTNFEKKTGWGTPFIEIENRKHITLLHSVDKKLLTYRVFGAMFEETKRGLELIAVTPKYIMEPKTIQEKYGDRPFVVFPCGLQKIDDYLLLTYGAADTFVGIGKINIDVLLSELEKGKLE